MLFGGVIVTNSVIGIIQELRARAALDRLAVLTEPRAVAWRDGVAVRPRRRRGRRGRPAGAALPGRRSSSTAPWWSRADSSSTSRCSPVSRTPCTRRPGDEVLSGSFVAVGSGTYRATRVGAASYAASLAEEARRFTLVDSELRRGVNTILKVLMVLIPPIAAILFWRLLEIGDGWRQALSGVVAAAVAMVPDGLVLLTSLAFMAGVMTLARRGALLRELASVELLARVDTLCLDKTGTITTGELAVAAIEPLGDDGRRIGRGDARRGRGGRRGPEPDPGRGRRRGRRGPGLAARRGRRLLLGPQVVRGAVHPPVGPRRRPHAVPRCAGAPRPRRPGPGRARRRPRRAGPSGPAPRALRRRRRARRAAARAARTGRAGAAGGPDPPRRRGDPRLLRRAGRPPPRHLGGPSRHRRRGGPTCRGARRRQRRRRPHASPRTPTSSPTSSTATPSSAGSPPARSRRWSSRCSPRATSWR